MNNKVLVLCSGGPDGAVAAAILLRHLASPMNVMLLHFEYGQRAAVKELEAVGKIAAHLRVGYITRQLNVFPKNALIDDGQPIAPEEMQGSRAFLPARNLIFLSVAAGIAAEQGIAYLAHGNIKSGIYPDNTMRFTEGFDNLLQCAVDVPMRCIGPVNNLTKVQVIDTGMKLGMPLEDTWSCYLGGEKHCGKCASCIGRRSAFAQLRITDPVPYEG